jgi:diguanylate cyclase (GGDEF)-like protein
MEQVIGSKVYATRHERVRRALAGTRVGFEIDADTLLGKKVLQIDYIPDFGPDGSVRGIYSLSYDVTALHDAKARLAQLVRTDALTGLANRYQFNESLVLALARSARSGKALALMFLDIDHFKRINDRLGHAAGDAILVEFARRLQHCVRVTDSVARLGGDEFVVVLEALDDEADAHKVARKILAEISRPFQLEERSLTATTSIGVAFCAQAQGNAEEVLARADAALYEVKAAGRNNYCLTAH